MPDNIKPFRTFEQQLNILRERELIIEDEEEAIEVLKKCNYYRLSGYSLSMRQNDKFNEDSQFSDLMQIYNFDSELRGILMYLLEHIEISFRTHIGYYHGERYGPLGYRCSKNFINPIYFAKFNEDIDKYKEECKDREVFIKHHNKHYSGNFPIWVIVELLSFGTLSRLFCNMHDDIKKIICKDNYNIPFDYVENWLHGFTILRNICAHRGRIYNKNINHAIKLSAKDRKVLGDVGIDINKCSKRLFMYLFVMKKLVESTVWNTFICYFENITIKYPFVKLSYYGFPENWQEFLINE